MKKTLYRNRIFMLILLCAIIFVAAGCSMINNSRVDDSATTGVLIEPIDLCRPHRQTVVGL